MRAILSALLVILPVISPPVHAESVEGTDWPADCKLERVAQVPMTLISGHVVIPASSNGRDLTLGIDTGGVFSSLTKTGIGKLGLVAPYPMTKGASYLGVGQILVGGGNVRLDNLRIGDLELDNVRIPMMEAFPGVDGLIGPDILGRYDTELDFGSKTFSLYKPHPCSDHAVTWTGSYAVIPFTFTPNRHVRMRVTLDGQNIDAILDTGAGISVMSMSDASSMFGLAPRTPGVEAANSVSGPFPRSVRAYTFAFKTLSMGGVTIQGPRVELAEGPNFLGSDTAYMVLGNDVLSHFHLYVAYHEKKLYLTDAEAH